jgi:hypothetical protein
MTPWRFRWGRTLIVVAGLAASEPMLSAQPIEIAPAAGYRFGGDFFELMTGRPVDLDGTKAVGALVNVPLSDGLQFEALFTHQRADVVVPAGPFFPAASWRMAVDHWQAGGLQEFSGGRMRPFATGTLGLTRFAAEADSELRFALGAGGGVKLYATPTVGLRLDGRLYATFVDGGTRAVACTTGTCFLNLYVDVVWQAEFTAGLVLRFR